MASPQNRVPFHSDAALVKRRRLSHYLEQFQRMDENARRAFIEIYHLANQHRGGGEHIVRVAIEAMKHPVIYKLGKENVMLRFSLAMAKKQHNLKLAERLEQVLDDFHTAADAFVKGFTLDDVAVCRSQPVNTASGTCGKLPQSLQISRPVDSVEYHSLFFFSNSLRASVSRLRQAYGSPLRKNRKPSSPS